MTDKGADPFVSVVVPAYNESENIAAFYEAVSAVLDRLVSRWELIAVDDGSRDDTFTQLQALNRRDGRVRAIGLSRNFGKEAALTAGLDHAGGDVVIPIDVDLQDPPELIADMLRLWSEGNDVVYATRTSRAGETWLKRVTAEAFYKVIGRVANVSIPANTGDFRLMDRRVLESLKELKETHRFMKGLFSWVGYRQISLPYSRKPRNAGQSKLSYWRLWNFAIEGVTSFSIAPLQIATYLGFVISLFSFGYALYIIFRTLILGVDIPGYASLLVAVLFFGGVQLLFIGIVGEYVGRIYDEVKRRPIYVIERKEGF